MKSKYTVYYSLLLALLLHISVVAAVLFAPESPTPLVVIPPTIQGVIVSVAPVEKPPEPLPPPPSPPPEQKPLPKPKIPLPKAPPSEHAIKQEPQSEPIPTAPVEQKPVEQKPVVQQAPVSPPQADASQLNNPAPVYPALSRRLKEEGTVILEVLVLADGSVGDLSVKISSGHERLDEAALRAVKHWHFIAAKRGDEAIDFSYELPIEFSLNK